MEKYLSQLNEAQLEPTIQKDGPMIIIAGAGSGKTRVLTYRIAYLMHLGVDPFNILSLTFTNKAAKEMKERIATIVGSSEAKNLWMGTFHSVFAKILRIEKEYIVIEKTGHQAETEALLNELQKIGIFEFVRSGRVAIVKPMERLNNYLKNLKSS